MTNHPNRNRKIVSRDTPYLAQLTNFGVFTITKDGHLFEIRRERREEYDQEFVVTLPAKQLRALAVELLILSDSEFS